MLAASDLTALVRAEALAAGFDGVRVTRPEAIGPAGRRLQDFLADGREGNMGWMATNAERRADPRVLWPDVRSIIMLAKSYAPADDPLKSLAWPERGTISCYAQRRDYHDVVKSGLKQIARALAAASSADVKVFVDTAPLMEKPLAQAAGLGWQGKHTNLVSREYGSWLFLGAILTTAALDADEADVDHCGSCTRCLDVCPTQAFPAPYQLDARRCIAYLTIEHKGPIPREFRRAVGNRVFGCDDCLAVCPWNKFAAASHDAKLQVRSETANPPLAELLDLDDAAFRARFAGTPVKRTGRDRFLRNVLVAAGNSGDAALKPAVERRLRDEAAVVRASAVWAAALLTDKPAWEHLRDTHVPRENDATVLEEWRASPSPDSQGSTR